jgi:AcrR family transcriptional regulator
VNSVTPEEPRTRDERRRRTEEAILLAAREQFAGSGYADVTIRSVAAAAGVDPALVMQYFGSKERLFGAAAQWPEEADSALAADRAGLPAAVLDDLFTRFEAEGTDREAVVALMRNCLTHPEAARIVRDEVITDRQAHAARLIGGPDAELRAALVGAVLMGVAMSRHLIEVPAVARADQDDLRRVLEPVVRLLVSGGGA